MKPSLVLAIDQGTQNVRALLFDPAGNLVGRGHQPIDPYFSRHPGWAEQHPDYFWDNLGQACRLLWQSTGATPDQVMGVTLTTQRGTVVTLDDQGRPLRPAIIWLDQRHADIHGPIPAPWGWLFRALRLEDTVNQFRRNAQANWLAQHEPDNWQRTRKYLLLSGYLTWRLTGQYRDSTACQVGYLPFDYRHHRWAGRRNFKWHLMPVRRNQLPELVRPGDTLGHLTADAARHLGVPAELPLIASASDKACEVLGSGGTAPDVACLSYGTTATINVTNHKYVEPVRLLPPYPSALPGHYSTEVMIYRGYWMVSWFKREFGLREQNIAEEQGIAPEDLFDELVNAVPPGSMGLMLQPYWSPAVRHPGPEAKGAMIGFGDVHTRAHIYRAILEGLAYALREGKERIEKRSGIPITTLRVAGGGARSDAAMQLTADIFGIPAGRAASPETSGLGAAMVAMAALGRYPSVEAAAKGMSRPAQVFEPDPEARQLYEQLYKSVYRPMYRRLAPLYKDIRRITGYPE
ncbi:FGGY-family carbohydrate kinase [Marinobacter zhanjiangensis]|uniref:Carbohydrate kinase n=1 Tax=Marinobacter zhanjiangensis TaxID=578215 RepID=A0ABQ3AUG0_9GAMM|nr:FGGY-family carbohydrate kinase [Marinobacter zhanjiangensis]GGY66977.1 carbohydrate kinase [Marinobacter zhanjiangensis]